MGVSLPRVSWGRSMLTVLFVLGADVHFAVEGITNAPVDIGGRLSIGLPLGLEVSTEVGVMPQVYAQGINGLLLAVKAYPPEVGVLIRTGLQSAFVWRTHLAYYFWRGFYLGAGYGLVTLGGGLTAGEALAAVTGENTPAGFPAGEQIRLTSSLHMIDAEVGYRFLFWDQLIVRVALGGAFTLGSQTRVSADRLLLDRSSYFQDFARTVEKYLDGTYKSYVFSPVITLGVGYRFF